MFCDRCGTELASAARFCSACGKPVGSSMVQSADAGRVNRHLTLLGVLWVAAAAIRVLSAVWLLTVGRVLLPYVLSWIPAVTMGFPASRLLHDILGAAAGFAVVWALLALVTAWGLLQHEPWGRTVALIAGILALIRIPFGTALGIYTLWVLMPTASEEEYRRLASAV